MSVAILGGLDRLKRSYEQTGKAFGYDVRFFGQRVPNMSKRLNGVDAIVLFTGTISHPMVKEAMKFAKQTRVPVSRSHTSSISGLKRCLEEIPTP